MMHGMGKERENERGGEIDLEKTSLWVRKREGKEMGECVG